MNCDSYRTVIVIYFGLCYLFIIIYFIPLVNNAITFQKLRIRLFFWLYLINNRHSPAIEYIDRVLGEWKDESSLRNIILTKTNNFLIK